MGKNPTSGVGTKNPRKTFPLMVKPVGEYSPLFVKKPFRKNMLKTFYLNLKWNSCKEMLLWRLQLKS